MLDDLLDAFGISGLLWVFLWYYVILFAHPIALIVGCFRLRAVIHRHRKNESSLLAFIAKAVFKDEWFFNFLRLPFLQRILWLLTLLPPLLLLIALRAMQWRASVLIGYWPQPMADDPKWIGQSDRLYQGLFDLTLFASGLAGWSILPWIVCLILMKDVYSRQQYETVIWCYLSIWIINLWASGDSVAWFMD